MQGRWAFNWVQVLAHAYALFVSMFGVLTLLAILGWLRIDTSTLDWPLLAVSLVLMSLVSMKLMDSIRTGMLLLLSSLLVLMMTIGMLGWFGIEVEPTSILAFVVVVFMTMSNLVHLLSTVLREMARGAFQHDAIAEALKLNVTPVFLTNVTTGLGFVVAAVFEPQFYAMAVIVLSGAVISYIVLLTWIPAIILKWFLEFRVGHYDDRHGFVKLAEKMNQHPKWTQLSVWIFVIFFGASAYVISEDILIFKTLGLMLVGSAVLLMLFWRDFKITLLVIVSCLMVVTLVLAGFDAVFRLQASTAFVLVVPLGIVLDDAIHYYARFLKSKRGFFNDIESCHRFALASVGRPIWLTTQLLGVGMLVLLFSDQLLVRQTSLITFMAVMVAAYVVLIWMPAFHLKASK